MAYTYNLKVFFNQLIESKATIAFTRISDAILCGIFLVFIAIEVSQILNKKSKRFSEKTLFSSNRIMRTTVNIAALLTGFDFGILGYNRQPFGFSLILCLMWLMAAIFIFKRKRLPFIVRLVHSVTFAIMAFAFFVVAFLIIYSWCG